VTPRAVSLNDPEVVKANADDNPLLSLCYGVQNIPTVLYFVDGQVRGQLVGTVSKEAILNLLSQDGEAARGDASSSQGGTI
jgi:thioredoxin-like negative regulator of GroEL